MTQVESQKHDHQLWFGTKRPDVLGHIRVAEGKWAFEAIYFTALSTDYWFSLNPWLWRNGITRGFVVPEGRRAVERGAMRSYGGKGAGEGMGCRGNKGMRAWAVTERARPNRGMTSHASYQLLASQPLLLPCPSPRVSSPPIKISKYVETKFYTIRIKEMLRNQVEPLTYPPQCYFPH